jgi:hypothetical protein
MPKFPADTRLDGLFDLALRDGVDIRTTLLRVLSDLYVQKPVHTQDEERQFVELSTALIDAVDPATRAAVAATLRDYPGTPDAVWCKLTAAAPPPPPSEDLCELFFSAEPDERRLILTNLLAPDMKLAPAPADVLAQLETSALQRNPAEFTRVLRAALGIAPRLAQRIVQDGSGEPLVVGMKALGMPPAALQRVLLFLNPLIGQSVGRVYELAKLYDDISPQAAAYMVAIWRRAAPRRMTAHDPQAASEERRRAREFATPSARRTAAPANVIRKPERDRL